MSDFTIDFVSDINRDHLMVEIYFRKQRLCQINKEQGSEKIEIEFLTDLYVLPEEVIMKFPLSEFEKAIKEAKESLSSCE